jgi:hypothetical protein
MYTVRLAEAVIKPSVSRIGDGYDHLVPSVSKRVLAETVNGRFKAEKPTGLRYGAASMLSNTPRSNRSIGSTIVH